jgi:DNA-binding PadR family transcriptional regulator
MQHLRGTGWVKAIALPDSPVVIARLLGNGWVEEHRIGRDRSYRLTDKGLAAKMNPVKIWAAFAQLIAALRSGNARDDEGDF